MNDVAVNTLSDDPTPQLLNTNNELVYILPNLAADTQGMTGNTVNYGMDGKYTLSEMNTEQPGFFENIIEQTGTALGGAIQTAVQTGSTALNNAITNAAPTTTTPATTATPSTMTPQKWGMLALGVLAVIWVYKQSKK